eukprot:TRINITY_DN75_c0_g1_i1.p1 TRINITY_DN75_c0_g1~~TRINITY_DN75_c0_g1_i1.p1  ORF type:complete len:397 (+),score=127.92 TRINITY_DN75_c0_g1_i1:509-1699(+)
MDHLKVQINTLTKVELIKQFPQFCAEIQIQNSLKNHSGVNNEAKFAKEERMKLLNTIDRSPLVDEKLINIMETVEDLDSVKSKYKKLKKLYHQKKQEIQQIEKESGQTKELLDDLLEKKKKGINVETMTDETKKESSWKDEMITELLKSYRELEELVSSGQKPININNLEKIPANILKNKLGRLENLENLESFKKFNEQQTQQTQVIDMNTVSTMNNKPMLKPIRIDTNKLQNNVIMETQLANESIQAEIGTQKPQSLIDRNRLEIEENSRVIFPSESVQTKQNIELEKENARLRAKLEEMERQPRNTFKKNYEESMNDSLTPNMSDYKNYLSVEDPSFVGQPLPYNSTTVKEIVNEVEEFGKFLESLPETVKSSELSSELLETTNDTMFPDPLMT